MAENLHNQIKKGNGCTSIIYLCRLLLTNNEAINVSNKIYARY